MNSTSENIRSEIGSSCPSRPYVENSASHAPTFSPSSVIRAQLSIETSVDSADPDILHMRASDETLDRYKEVIVASGWRLENYLRNPVIQNAHQYGDIIFTIGRAEKTWVSGNALLQTWRFASNENPFAKIARDLYRGKFLQAASVGFIPLKWEDVEGSPGAAGLGMAGTLVPRRRYTEQELIEVSAVGIPANPNALTLALKAGAIEKSDLRELFQLLKHIVAADVSPWHISPTSSDSSYQSDSVSSVFNQPAFRALARQARDIARQFQQPQQQPPQGAPLNQTISGGNQKENL